MTQDKGACPDGHRATAAEPVVSALRDGIPSADRGDLGMKMLAAWLNVGVDQIPPENSAHLNAHTMDAWQRVGEAAAGRLAPKLDRFIRAIHEESPNGEWVLVQHHPNGDWSVCDVDQENHSERLLAALIRMVDLHGKRGGEDDALLPPEMQEPEVSDAMLAIAAAQGIAAGTDETPQEVRPEGQEPGSQSECAQTSPPSSEES